MLLHILRRLYLRVDRNRLGEVLVQDGVIDRIELRKALKLQKQDSLPLGQILVKYKYVSKFTLQRALFEQIAYRSVAAMVTLIISFSVMGMKNSRAGDLKDIPSYMLTLADAKSTPVGPLTHYPALFNSKETRSSNLRPFTKWASVFDRLDRDVRDARKGVQTISLWQQDLNEMAGLPISIMAEKVNSYVNQHPYITDDENWNQSDYWATPLEFFERGGDCEDFAIAKYASLRMLGVPEERLRLAIVHDKKKNIPHAVLIVYTERGAMVLDNQRENAIMVDQVKRYRPIFSINRTAWWLHTVPADNSSRIRLASAE